MNSDKNSETLLKGITKVVDYTIGFRDLKLESSPLFATSQWFISGYMVNFSKASKIHATPYLWLLTTSEIYNVQ